MFGTFFASSSAYKLNYIQLMHVKQIRMRQNICVLEPLDGRSVIASVSNHACKPRMIITRGGCVCGVLGSTKLTVFRAGLSPNDIKY